jgi:hypothetical protein
LTFLNKVIGFNDIGIERTTPLPQAQAGKNHGGF